MTYDSGAAVWSFDPTRWGVCVQAPTRGEALATWRRRFGAADVVGLVEGDEQAFERDHEPASDLELVLTTDVLARQRERALTTLARLPPVVLDDDPAQELPGWARWRTILQRLWHVCDTESRYYLLRAGLPTRPRAPTLEHELRRSAAHVRDVLASMPRAAVHRTDGEVWTSTKLLRRLARHERGELDAIDDLLIGGWPSSAPGAPGSTSEQQPDAEDEEHQAGQREDPRVEEVPAPPDGSPREAPLPRSSSV